MYHGPSRGTPFEENLQCGKHLSPTQPVSSHSFTQALIIINKEKHIPRTPLLVLLVTVTRATHANFKHLVGAKKKNRK